MTRDESVSYTTVTTDVPVMVEKTDEEGNVVYEEDGVTPVMVEKVDAEGNVVYETEEVKIVSASFKHLYNGAKAMSASYSSSKTAISSTYYDVDDDLTVFLINFFDSVNSLSEEVFVICFFFFG